MKEEGKNLKDDDDSKWKEDKYGKEKHNADGKVEKDNNPPNEHGEGKVTKGKDPKENNSRVEEDNPRDDDDGKNPKEKKTRMMMGKSVQPQPQQGVSSRAPRPRETSQQCTCSPSLHIS